MKKIEQRSLNLAKWANLFMAVAGIVAAIASHASALMLDGLFSGVNFLAAVLAARVAASIQQKPNALRPFGYEIDEAMYVMFRSLVLTGVVLLAGFGAAGKIIDYIGGASMPAVKLNWVVVYMVVMVTVCSFMAVWHHRHWLNTDRKSELLKAERGACIIDGVLSAAAGAAFLIISLLENTALSFLVPISDAIVVLCLTAYMIPTPIRAFIDAVKEVVGESAGPEILEKWRTAINGTLRETAFSLVGVAVTKMGRSHFAVAYIRPDTPVSADGLDDIRKRINNTIQSIHSPSRMEIIFTRSDPYAEIL